MRPNFSETLFGVSAFGLVSLMLHLSHFIHSDGAGGGPKVVRQLLEGLDPTRFRQSLIHGGSGDLTRWCKARGIDEIEVPATSVLSGILGFKGLLSALRRQNPDILILHGQWAGPMGAFAARWAKIPRSIYIAHCPAFYHSTTLFLAMRNYVAEKIPCSLCDRVVALSDGSYYNYLYRGWAPEEHLVKISNGVDPGEIPAAQSVTRLQRDFSWLAGGRNAVFVGRIDDQKRVDWLLEAWHFAIRSNFASKDLSQNWHLWIVGDGKQRNSMERQSARLALQDSVHFVGSQPEGMEWIAASDLLVLSSLYEGHALVPLEAMACGKPVAAFDTDGIADSVADGENGLLAPLGDTSALGTAIARLLANPEESLRMGRAGRERLLARFPLQKAVDHYAALIRDLVHPAKHS